MIPRKLQALKIRQDAAELASLREHPVHVNNGEEFKYRIEVKDEKDPSKPKNQPSHIANFTKGLPHDLKTGLLLNPVDYQQFVLGIQSGDPKDFAQTPLGPVQLTPIPGRLSIEATTIKWKSQIAQEAEDDKGAKVRAWESAGAGLVFELEGFDSQGLTMPPAPTLDSVELAAEMAEVYLQALLRDVHFSQLRDNSIGGNGDQHEPPVSCSKSEETKEELADNSADKVSIAKSEETKEEVADNSSDKIQKAIEILNKVKIDDRNWFNSDATDFYDLFDNPQLKKLLSKPNCLFHSIKLTEAEKSRKRPRVTEQNLFRGITPGDQIGPYLSQFLLIGNPGLNGNKNSQVLDTKDGFIAYGSVRVDQRVRTATPCKDYMTTFEAWLDVQNGADVRGLETYEDGTGAKAPYRFITTPRDLATYVHYDALYEAYLNACLILLGMGAPFDPGIPFQRPDVEDKQQGFAHFGGPQILTLVCEVATRALKAVRYQKFNTHRRLRPEAVGGLIDRYKKATGEEKEVFKPIAKLAEALDKVGLLDLVVAHNKEQNKTHDDRKNDASNGSDLYLLPMAFPEGSPMHPSYGAGHATVAGACVTILKAFFDHGWQISKMEEKEGLNKGKYISYEPNADGSGLQKVYLNEPLTVEGELNKIASNISIGRDWAGVHYFTDYIESLRMGEQIAIGILEEQKLTYGENFTMTVPLFDGGAIRI